MKQYDTYKDSGIAWIGEIPSEWEVVRLKRIFHIVAGATPKSDVESNWDGNIAWITPADYTTDQKYISKGKRSLSVQGFNSCSTVLLPKDCIVFSKRAPIGLVAITDNELCTNQGCLGCIPIAQDNIVYLYYALSVFTEQFELFGSGTTFKEISAFNFANFEVPLPTFGMQNSIATFLDKKCDEIDELISLQEESISELQAYKQSVITEAVTKGLNPHAKMKDSGVEWIGEIPEGWQIRRIKNIGDSKNGLTYSPANMVDESEGILVLRSSNIQNGKLCFDDNVYVSCEIPNTLLVKKGDIIICSRNGSAALVGKCAMVENDMIATYGAFMMRFQSIYIHKYIYYLLSCAISQYKQLFSTTTINQLTVGVFGGLAMPFTVNQEEQHSIATYLDEKTSQIDSLISLKQEKIQELKDYKKSIIYEYVTGKKRV